MKKQITALALSLAGLSSAFAFTTLGEISGSSTVAFESEYVFRGGSQYAEGNAVQPGVEFSAPVFEGDAYIGYWGSYAKSNTGGFSETDLYVGYGQALTDYVSIDGGVTYYGFEKTAGGQNRWHEVYLGFSFDGLLPEYIELSPAIYAYYNFSGEAWTIESSIGHSLSLEQVADNLSLDLGAYLGVADFGDALGDQVAPTLRDEDGYTYWGGSADLVYTLNEVASVSLGVRYSANNNNNGATGGANLYIFRPEDSLFWWGTSASFGF